MFGSPRFSADAVGAGVGEAGERAASLLSTIAEMIEVICSTEIPHGVLSAVTSNSGAVLSIALSWSETFRDCGVAVVLA